jgi:BirA family biotin operon repressor/biotin-[acetyl-CoA-carboxylase] ligase
MTPMEIWQLGSRYLGQRVYVFDQVDSTNTRAALLADDLANHGLAIVANSQTAGRGQHNRTWLCQPGTGVLLSLLLFPPPHLRRPVMLTAWAAVSVCELVAEAADLQATIKWPNDVLVQGRKVCGILIEQVRGIVVGIGLNVNQSAEALCTAGLKEAGSLQALTGKPFDVAELARQLIRHLDTGYGQLLALNLTELEQHWQRRLGLVDESVVLECADGVHHGRLLDLSFETVIVQADEGGTLQIRPEAVKHIHLANPNEKSA